MKRPPVMLVDCEACNREGYLLDVLVTEPCDECDGKGYHEEVSCPLCEGSGEVEVGGDVEACPRCFGDGVLRDVECRKCGGSGDYEYHPRCPHCEGRGTVPHPWYDASFQYS